MYIHHQITAMDTTINSNTELVEIFKKINDENHPNGINKRFAILTKLTAKANKELGTAADYYGPIKTYELADYIETGNNDYVDLNYYGNN